LPASSNIGDPFIFERSGLTIVPGNSGQDSPEAFQGLADLDTVILDEKFAKCALVGAGSLLEDADRLTDLRVDFEVAQEKNCVREITDIELGGIRHEQSVLGHDNDGDDSLLV
jgi:hypothetical protein